MTWRIDVDWEALSGAPDDESACFGAIGIRANDHWVTEGHDYLANRLRNKPYLSGYHLAEWLAWNWWRLRWEPRASSPEWAQSHNMLSIGQGYIWPNLTIFCDGERAALISVPTKERASVPYRYISGQADILPAKQLEAGIDEYFSQVLQRLDAQEVKETNFHLIFRSLTEERSNPQLSQRRKFEALLGEEPDESDPDILDQLIADSDEVSVDAIQEIAAAGSASGRPVALVELKDFARVNGFDTHPRDAVRLRENSGLAPSGTVPAWVIGGRAARRLRDQEHLVGPISDRMLASFIGAPEAALAPRSGRGGEISFVIDDARDVGHMVLRSKWHDGRRFELARLLGDRLLTPRSNRLFPATQAYTYRQKVQRAFAAELLSPFDEVEAFLGGDYSIESQSDAADHFNVSSWVIRTLLMNHGRLRSEEFGDELDLIEPYHAA